jgi:hypothetical protein
MDRPEPTDVFPEKEFQKAIVAVLREILTASGRRFVLLEGFGLDIAVFIAAQSGPIARFIEVKAFGAQRMGGVGFGNSRGQGSQVDLLLTPDNCFSLLYPSVRWAYADATQVVGSRRYCLFTSDKAKAAAMGGVTRGKQNNLRISALQESLVDWPRFLVEFERFLLPEESKATGISP